MKPFSREPDEATIVVRWTEDGRNSRPCLETRRDALGARRADGSAGICAHAELHVEADMHVSRCSPGSASRPSDTAHSLVFLRKESCMVDYAFPQTAVLKQCLKRASGIGLLLLVTACASIQHQPFVGPGGKIAYASRCSQIGYTLEECYRRAGDHCASGYKVLDDIAGTVGVPARGGVMSSPHHNVTIECK
jgi:hypothetical protein